MPRSDLAGGLAEIIGQLLAYEEEAFELDVPVDGGDLVAFWAQVRPQLKAAATRLE